MNFMPSRHALLPSHQRAAGALALGFKRSGDVTRIDTFYQQGCLKTRLPRPANPGICEAITVNISGGIASGDALSTSINLGPHAAACVSSQAAERIYRALDAAPACITTRITLSPGAALDYLPQETILFDGFGLHRSLEINMASDARFLGVESLVFGRQAMGEAVKTGSLRDCISLRRDGVLLLQDSTRLEGDITAALARKAVAGGRMAMACLLYAAPAAPAKLDAVRKALAAHNCAAGASVMDGVLRARILAPSAISLRNCLIAVLNICRDGRPLPRTWQS